MDYELYHHGILGMKWGVRRYQNKDGSLTAAGRKRYSNDKKSGKVTVTKVADYTNRKHGRYWEIDPSTGSTGSVMLDESNAAADRKIQRYWDEYEKDVKKEFEEAEAWEERAKNGNAIDRAKAFIYSLFDHSFEKGIAPLGISVKLTEKGRISEAVEKGASWLGSKFGFTVSSPSTEKYIITNDGQVIKKG